MKAKARIEVQMFDGDGVEPTEIRRARELREREEKEAAQAAAYEAKKLKQQLDYKHSLKSHPLTVPAIKFKVEHLREDITRLIILTECPPESFNHILEIHRPKLTVRSPMESYHHTVAEIEYPMVWVFHNPKARTYKWEELHIDGVTGRQRRDNDGFTRIFQHTLTFTCSKAQDHSARTYKNLKELIRGKVPA